MVLDEQHVLYVTLRSDSRHPRQCRFFRPLDQAFSAIALHGCLLYDQSHRSHLPRSVVRELRV